MIVITRGDNCNLKFQRKNSSGVITDVADEIYFTVKKDSITDDVIIQKKLSTGDIVFNNEDYYYRFEIKPEDTNDLLYGNYKYDIERIVGLNKKTIVVGTILISEEVTFAKNE